VRILCVTDSSEMGGAESQMIALFRALVAEGHQVSLLSSGEGFASAARAAGLAAESLRRPLRSIPGLAAAVGEIRRRSRILGAEVVHAEGVRACVVAAMAHLGVSRRPGLVVTIHNLMEPGPRAHRLVSRIVQATGACLTTVSESERSRYLAQGFPPTRCRSVHNGIALSPAVTAERRRAARGGFGLPVDAVVLACVARLGRKKGHATLLEALVDPSIRTSPILVLAAGEGTLRAELESLRDHLGLSDRVRFLGFRSDVPAILQASDAAVLPSLSEVFPMSLLEAMSVGLPVVATRVGGVPEMMADGREGWIVEPGDAKGLARALHEATHDPAERARRGHAARDRVGREFSLERMVREMLAVYQGVADAPAVEARR